MSIKLVSSPGITGEALHPERGRWFVRWPADRPLAPPARSPHGWPKSTNKPWTVGSILAKPRWSG